MEIVYDFLEGRCDYEKFREQLYSNEEIFNWLQSLYFDGMIEDETFWCENQLWRSEGNVKEAIKALDSAISAYEKDNVYNFLYWFLLYACPNRIIQRIDVYYKRAKLYTYSVSDCYGGPEVDGMISDIIESVPENLSETKKIKFVKDKLKDLFPGKKRPFWIELPDWPVSNGKPMEYITKKSIGDLFMYFFRDVETGEERIVKQYA